MRYLNYVLLSLSALVFSHPVLDARDAPIGTIALTFDDGPSSYTPQLLDILAEYNAKATFFIVGSTGRGTINDWNTQWPSLLQRMHNEGHQLASHTWTHGDLSTLSWNDMAAEVTNNENAFLDVFGFMPTYFRAPYLSCNDACVNYLASLGYKIIGTDLDTKDYESQTPDTIWRAKENFDRGLNQAGTLALAHDIHYQTVVSLTPHMLTTLLARGLRPVTVGECLGDDAGQWYQGRR